MASLSHGYSARELRGIRPRTSGQPKHPLIALALLLCLVLPAAAQQVDLKVHPAPDFGAGVVWLDEGAATPHHISDYKGKVVLIDFWEYTCINCVRDFGVLKRWYTKYHPYGFEVIGVHYGEFEISFDVNNVREGAQRYKLPWPVVADQKGTTWQAYQADGWPERFLIDPQGQIVMKVFGEGKNVQMETKIRELLAVAHPEVLKIPLDTSDDESDAKCGNVTQEAYVGENHGRGAVEDMNGHHAGETAEFVPPHSPPDGGVELVGKWKVEKDGMTAEAAGANAEVRYHARSMYAVMSLSGPKMLKVYLMEDGGPFSKDDAGADVKFDAKGAYVEVTEGRMYYLVRSPRFAAHLISLEPEAPGLTLHSFTYGNNCQLQDMGQAGGQ